MTEEIMTEEKKKGRGRPKGAPNKPLMELETERRTLTNNADVYEILCQTNIVATEDEDKAINGLRYYSARNGAVKPVLKWIFDDNIKSTLPEGPTPFNKNDAPATDLAENALRFEFKNFKYYVTEQVPLTKREHMWIQLLEGISIREAEMMDLIKDKRNPFKSITKNLVSNAFPELL